MVLAARTQANVQKRGRKDDAPCGHRQRRSSGETANQCTDPDKDRDIHPYPVLEVRLLLQNEERRAPNLAFAQEFSAPVN